MPRGVTCPDCRQDTPIHGTIHAGSYANTALRRGVHWLKFKQIRDISPILAWLIAQRIPSIEPLNTLERTSALIPIPLHRMRQRTRGFNQSYDISQNISRLLNIPLYTPLVRHGSSPPQARLPHDMRKENVASAFSVDTQHLPWQHIRTYIIVDDVITTGSTISAAARALQASLPDSDIQIWSACVARW